MILVRDQSGFRGSWTYEFSGDVHLIAEGRRAQGDAGRAGGGPEILIRLLGTDGSHVDITRTGRLYSKPARIRIYAVDNTVSFDDLDALEATESASGAW